MEFLFQEIPTFLNQYGYWAVFILGFTGPIGSAAAGFFVSLGLFNFIYVWGLTVLADLFTDQLYYEVGQRGGRPILSKLSKFFRWSAVVQTQVQNFFNKHGYLTVFVSKFAFGTGTITQILAGTSGLNRKHYILINLAASSLRNILFISLGIVAGTLWRSWYEQAVSIGWTVTGTLALLALATIIFKNVKDYFEREGQA